MWCPCAQAGNWAIQFRQFHDRALPASPQSNLEPRQPVKMLAATVSSARPCTAAAQRRPAASSSRRSLVCMAQKQESSSPLLQRAAAAAAALLVAASPLPAAAELNKCAAAGCLPAGALMPRQRLGVGSG